MVIKLLKRAAIDVERWNSVVSKHGNGLVYASSEYLDSVCNWQALILDDYQYILPLPINKKLGLKYVYTPFLVQQLGVVGENLTKEIEDAMLAAIPKGVKLVELSLNEESFQNDQYPNVLLDLTPSYDDLKKKYKTNLKRNLAKVGGDLSIKEVEIESLFKLFTEDKGDVVDWGENHLTMFKKLIGSVPCKWMIEGVYKSESLLAGAVWLKTSSRLIFLFSGNTDEGRENKALMYLIDEKIKEYSGQDLILDFEGSSNEGLKRFYLNYGGKEVQYAKLNRYKFPINILKK